MKSSFRLFAGIAALSALAACDAAPDNACDELGATRCLADLTGTERCRSNGLWELVQSCGERQQCMTDETTGASACVTDETLECGELGATRCLPDLSGTERCRSNGQWEVVQQCGYRQACETGPDGGSGCVTDYSLECGELGATRCMPDLTATERCRSNGQWEVVQVCVERQECVTSETTGGSGCVTDYSLECGELGTTRCAADGSEAVEACRSDGAWAVIQRCSSDGECVPRDDGTGRCVSDDSVECGEIGSTRCLPNLSGVERCRPNGQWERVQSCLANQTCQLAASGGSECVVGDTLACGELGATRCLADGLGTQRCMSHGLWEVVEWCQNGSGCETFPTGDSGCVTDTSVSCGVVGATRCLPDGSANEVCRSDGNWQVLTRCSESETCRVNASGVQGCVGEQPLSCGAHGATRCLADRTGAEMCRSNGQWGVFQRCPEGGRCEVSDTGASRCVASSALTCGALGATRCRADGRGIERCGEDGAWSQVQACADGALCDLDDHEDGALACVGDGELACGTLDATRCRAGDVATERCAASGDWTLGQACQAGQRCQVNAAGEAQCASTAPTSCGQLGATRCRADGRGVEWCNGFGAWTLLEACPDGGMCEASGAGARCGGGALACGELGATRCRAGGVATERCASSGDWTLVQACQAGDVCEVGSTGAAHCVPYVASPPLECGVVGATRCLPDGSGREQCQSSGAWTVTQWCGASQTCALQASGAASCVAAAPPACVVGETRCLPDGRGAERCTSAGWGIVQTCWGSESCQVSQSGQASCVAPTVPACSPLGATRCLGDATAVERCRSNGLWEVVSRCAGGAMCEVPGFGDARCVASTALACGQLGATRCLANGSGREQCRSDGQWAVVQTCTASQMCAVQSGVAACVSSSQPTCTVGATRCLPSGTGAERCGSNGAWSVSQTCTATQRCELAANGDAACATQAAPASCGVAGATRCLADGTGAERCRTNGQWEVVQWCASGEYCEDGACEPDGVPVYPDPTTTDTSSPWYERGCPLVQHAEFPTALAADCRCFTNQAPVNGIPLCHRPYHLALNGGAVGTGPSYANVFNTEYNGGLLDEAAGRVYVAVGYGPGSAPLGAVLVVDIATGNRTLLSGTHPSGASAGTGHALGAVREIARGPDDKLYAWVQTAGTAQPEVVRVDPSTGARTLMWRGRDAAFAQCAPPGAAATASLQYTYSGFAMDATGRAYVPFANPTQGRGIVRLAANFGACEVVTGTGAITYAQRGTGPTLGGFVQGFTFRDGVLYAFTTQPKQFFSVDVTTGNRSLLLTLGGVTPAERWPRWDAGRGIWWLAGLNDSVTISAWDPADNRLVSIFNGGVFPWMPLGAAGPIQINALNYAPVWVRANGNLLVAQDGFSIVEYEPSTGNSIIISL